MSGPPFSYTAYMQKKRRNACVHVCGVISLRPGFLFLQGQGGDKRLEEDVQVTVVYASPGISWGWILTETQLLKGGADS